jgi:large subunit ribosomal protein L5
MNQLKQRYQKDIVPKLMKTFSFKSVMQVPKIEKIVLNMGIGDATSDSKLLELGFHELELIAGQKPVKTKAKKSIATFKLRQGQEIGAKVTLRGNKM